VAPQKETLPRPPNDPLFCCHNAGLVILLDLHSSGAEDLACIAGTPGQTSPSGQRERSPSSGLALHEDIAQLKSSKPHATAAEVPYSRRSQPPPPNGTARVLRKAPLLPRREPEERASCGRDRDTRTPLANFKASELSVRFCSSSTTAQPWRWSSGRRASCARGRLARSS
jgi:hypothetical protein